MDGTEADRMTDLQAKQKALGTKMLRLEGFFRTDEECCLLLDNGWFYAGYAIGLTFYVLCFDHEAKPQRTHIAVYPEVARYILLI